jgi:hypothetical protein
MNTLNNNVHDLENFYRNSAPKTVQEWNAVRESAKEVYTNYAISAIDASGLISKIIPPTIQ